MTCILELPQISSVVEGVTVSEGTSLLLPCSCTGSPVPTINWYLPNGWVVSSSSNYQTQVNGSLSISITDCNRDHGSFRCLCENIVGSDSIDIPVSVKCKYWLAINVYIVRENV